MRLGRPATCEAMAKGEYEFPILVTCLLILGLQIHNPFQPGRQGACDCSGGPPGSDVGRRPADGAAAAMQGQAAARQPPATYRPPREAAITPQTAGGMSPDALLRELDSIQAKARDQQETLAAAGRMPPPSPILQHLRETEAHMSPSPATMPTVGQGGRAQPPPPPMGRPVGPPGAAPPMAQPMGVMGGAASDGSLVRRRDEFGRFLQARQPGGLGVVLGVGRGDFAMRLLNDWGTAQGIYLVDPFIHIWRGYEDPANLNDREHQMIFEDLRNRLQPYEGRYVLVRDFSHSFAETYQRGGTAPGPPSFVYVDANHAEEAVARDLELWWPLLAPGGIISGSTYVDDDRGRVKVRAAVDRFASQNGLKVYLTQDDMPPSWMMMK